MFFITDYRTPLMRWEYSPERSPGGADTPVGIVLEHHGRVLLDRGSDYVGEHRLEA